MPDIGDLDGRFGKDPSDMSGVRNFDNGAATIDGRNLTDREARPHTSLRRDYAPLPGRAVAFGIRAWF